MVRILFLLAATVLVVVVLGLYRGAQPREPVVSVQFIMDTVVEQSLHGKNAQVAANEAETLLRELEGELSLYRSGSRIDAINAAAGEGPVVLDTRTFELLSRSVEFGAASDGGFDITTAPLAKLWNITGDNPRVPAQSEIDALLPLVGYESLALDEAAYTAFLPQAGQELDLGGVAKGYAAALCLELYNERGVSGYVSVGGNIAASGLGSDGEPFRFGIRSPRGESGYVGSVELTDTIMATSGDYERYFESDGVRYHHILDPNTGYPSQSGLISVSVVCRDGAAADFLSTALFLRGRNGLETLAALYDYEYVAIDGDLNIYVSQGLRESFRLNPEAREYHLLS